MNIAATPSAQPSTPPCIVVGLDRVGDLTAKTDTAFNALMQRPASQAGCNGAIVSSAQIAQLLTPR